MTAWEALHAWSQERADNRYAVDSGGHVGGQFYFSLRLHFRESLVCVWTNKPEEVEAYIREALRRYAECVAADGRPTTPEATA